MATLIIKKDIYSIRFSKRTDYNLQQKTFSLRTKDKRKAEKLLYDYEDKYERGLIDPFGGWSPAEEADRKQIDDLNANLSLQQAVDRFLHERTQANAITKKGYQKVFRMLIDQLGKSMPIKRIKPQDIRDLCFRPALAAATQRSYFTHLKVFFRWLNENDLLEINLVRGIKPPKLEDRVVSKVIDESQLQHLFRVFDQHIEQNVQAGFIKHPNQRVEWFKPMISTFFYAGLRSKELIHLRWKHILDDFRYILVANDDDVTTKSGRARKVPIRSPLAIVLRDWRKKVDPKPEDFVFSNVTTQPGKQKMDSFRISHTFKRFARMADLSEDCNIHGLRHSFGTDLLRKGIPINRVSEMMGHSTIEVTKIYQHLTLEDLYESIKGIDSTLDSRKD